MAAVFSPLSAAACAAQSPAGVAVDQSAVVGQAWKPARFPQAHYAKLGSSHFSTGFYAGACRSFLLFYVPQRGRRQDERHSDRQDPEIHDEPAASEEANGRRCLTPRQGHHPQNRNQGKARQDVQDHTRCSVRVRLQNPVRRRKDDRLRHGVRLFRLRQEERAQAQTGQARTLREEKDLTKTAQGTQEQNEEGQRHQEGLGGRCWQKVSLDCRGGLRVQDVLVYCQLNLKKRQLISLIHFCGFWHNFVTWIHAIGLCSKDL